MYNFRTVATSIAAMNITGLTIRDYSGIPDGVTERMCPIMFPFRGKLLSNFQFVREGFGPASTTNKDVIYDMGYILAFAPVSLSLSRTNIEADLVDMVSTVLTAFHDADTLIGCDNIEPVGVEIITYDDGANNSYIACNLTLRVLEYL